MATATALGLGIAVAAAVSPRAQAAEAPPPAGEPTPPTPTPTPAPPPATIAAPRRALAPAPLWREGGLAVPFIGINSLQGDAGKTHDVGFRLGALAGLRLAENWSVNAELAVDFMSPHEVPGESASEYLGHLGLAPLYHLPLPKVEVVAGPALGAWFDFGHATALSQTVNAWSYGWTLGLNAGAFIPVRGRTALGLLLSFKLDEPSKACVNAATETCSTSGLTSAKLLGITAAALL